MRAAGLGLPAALACGLQTEHVEGVVALTGPNQRAQRGDELPRCGHGSSVLVAGLEECLRQAARTEVRRIAAGAANRRRGEIEMAARVGKPAAAIDRARCTVRAAGDGLIRGADRLRRSVEDTARREQR